MTFSVGNGARIYRPDFFTVPTDFWLNLYWLLLCGTLMYLLGYGIRATLVLRQDPRSRRIANFYLVVVGVRHLACIVRITTAYRAAIADSCRQRAGVVVRLHVRRRVRARVGAFLANQDQVVHKGFSLTPSVRLICGPGNRRSVAGTVPRRRLKDVSLLAVEGESQ